MKHYSIQRADGGVMVMHVLDDAGDPAAELAKWHPSLRATAATPRVIVEIDPATIPADRSFRAAWRANGAAIEVDMAKARIIHALKLDEAISELDRRDSDAHARADLIDDTPGAAVLKAKVKARQGRQAARTAAIANAGTPAALLAVSDPDLLP